MQVNILAINGVYRYPGIPFWQSVMWLESRSIGKVSTTGLLKMWKLTIGRLLDVVFIIQSYAFCWIKKKWDHQEHCVANHDDLTTGPNPLSGEICLLSMCATVKAKTHDHVVKHIFMVACWRWAINVFPTCDGKCQCLWQFQPGFDRVWRPSEREMAVFHDQIWR